MNLVAPQFRFAAGYSIATITVYSAASAVLAQWRRRASLMPITTKKCGR